MPKLEPVKVCYGDSESKETLVTLMMSVRETSPSSEPSWKLHNIHKSHVLMYTHGTSPNTVVQMTKLEPVKVLSLGFRKQRNPYHSDNVC